MDACASVRVWQCFEEGVQQRGGARVLSEAAAVPVALANAVRDKAVQSVGRVRQQADDTLARERAHAQDAAALAVQRVFSVPAQLRDEMAHGVLRR